MSFLSAQFVIVNLLMVLPPENRVARFVFGPDRLLLRFSYEIGIK